MTVTLKIKKSVASYQYRETTRLLLIVLGKNRGTLEPVNLKPLYYKLARLERCLTDLPTFAAGPY